MLLYHRQGIFHQEIQGSRWNRLSQQGCETLHKMLLELWKALTQELTFPVVQEQPS